MISFLVTTKNEGDYIFKLLNQLVSYMGDEDEIVIVDDHSDNKRTLGLLDHFSFNYNVNIHKHHLNKDFASHKNFGKEQCNNKWIFQIDADEYMSDYLAVNLHTLLEYNEDVDLIAVPRVNIVNGLTQKDISKWNWRVNEDGWVMWPDYQTRIFQNKPEIMWKNKVHEVITGHKSFTTLPQEKEWALYHIKDIDRQREQNALYETI
jgi:glycosyltransferase involved in cell wall biosynthesis